MVARIDNPGGRSASSEWLTASDVAIRRVPFDAPWEWFGAGWRDITSVPGISLPYGAVFTVIALLLVAGLLETGMISLILAFAGGFILLGPLVAVGLYEASRRLEANETVSFGDVVSAGLRAPGQLGFFGAILAFAFAIWLQLAFLLFMLFMGGRGFPPLDEFMPMLLFTPGGLGLLIVGTIVGGILASLVFAISAVSVPLMMEHRVDAVTAISVSLRAVATNPKPMALWAGLIAAFMVLGILTMFAGLVIAFPLIGHATWHAYRAMIDPAPRG